MRRTISKRIESYNTSLHIYPVLSSVEAVDIMKPPSTDEFFPLTKFICQRLFLWPLKNDGSVRPPLCVWDFCPLIILTAISAVFWAVGAQKVIHLLTLVGGIVKLLLILTQRQRLGRFLQRLHEENEPANGTAGDELLRQIHVDSDYVNESKELQACACY